MQKSFFSGRFIKFSVLALTLGFAVFSFHGKVFAASGDSETVHVVTKGETLYSISRSYGVTVDQLRSANGLSSSSVIKVGQKLSIPSASMSSGSSSSSSKKYELYTVKKGDTLYRIAVNNSISVNQLKNYNHLDSSPLKVGQELRIPLSAEEIELASLPDLTANDPRTYSGRKGDPDLQWPVIKPDVTYLSGKVGGVHLSAQKNEPVTAIREGTVMFTGEYRGYGQVVLVVAKSGHMYVYAGLGSIRVSKGDTVKFGTQIGNAGTDTIKGTSQITLMVYKKTTPIDPASAPRG